MDRRAFLSAVGACAAALAGCTGSPTGTTPTTPGEPTRTATVDSTPPTDAESTPTMRGPRAGDGLPDDDTPDDGYPPTFDTMPASRSIDTASFRTISRDGEAVPLAPIEAAYYWYARGEARFADARGAGQYETSHIYGAAWSPYDGSRENDPAEEWSTDDRIVCYCGCPTHLSSIRAADLIANGYTDVSVIAEGFWEWTDRNYPIAGADVQSRPALRVIQGRVDARHAGETAWARHDPTGQVEATEIGPDGRFELHLRFADVDAAAEVTVSTPGYRVTAPLVDLTDGVVTA